MYAVDKILTHPNFNFKTILEHYKFNNIKIYGNTIRAACKIHNGNNPTAFVVNLDNNLWYCHTGDCGGGDVFTLVEKLERVSFKQAVKIIAEILSIDIANMDIAERQLDYIKEMQTWLKLMKEKKGNVKYTPYIPNGTFEPLTTFRDFNVDTINFHKASFAKEIFAISSENKMFTLYNQICIPLFYKEMQIGISLRKTNQDKMPKWIHQPPNIATRNLLYNFDNVKTQTNIVVVEGIFDVWAFHEIGFPAVATFGAHMTNHQYKKLFKTGANIIFCYDNDNAGRIATEKAYEKFKNKANMYKINLPDDQDPSSITRETLLQCVKDIKHIG